ncbi:MAG TPA: acyl-CoA dehydrogenase family protein [Dehalococcoidales bacterium]|nr:acyl-CoA dehydrogenase family protein [Dehalococcoidales bacterium]
MEYFFSEEQKMIRGLARRLAEERILPRRMELDESEEFPRDIVDEIGAADLFRVFVPAEYEGLGGGCLDLCLVMEELSRVCSGVAISYAASALGSYTLMDYGSETLKRKFLPDIASGKKLAAFALTESGAGSDAGAIRTTAEKVPGGYLINGTKQFITNGGEADIYTLIVVTDKTRGARGASAILVEKGTAGFTFGKKEKKMGIRASATRELVFQNCLVPEENLIGRPGMGFILAMKLFDKSRPGVAAQALGIAQGALEAAFGYTRDRIQFGQALINQPVIQYQLAEMATKIEAARALVYAAARNADSSKDCTESSAMAKVFASDVAMEVTTLAVQLCGGLGYMRDYPVEKMMRDAKITQIYEGSNQILTSAIGLELRKRKAKTE